MNDETCQSAVLESTDVTESGTITNEPTGLFEVLIASLCNLWKEPTEYMEVTVLSAQSGHFSLNGSCPHCNRSSVFMIVGAPVNDPIGFQSNYGAGTRVVAAMQCQGCRQYLLGIVTKPNSNQNALLYIAHYPLGKPNDAVAKEIPEHIGSDFKEALRCRWVDAHNATVEMCRRAVQASCIDLGAPTDQRLVNQIDWLASNGTITNPLKEMAHRIRLGGNLGAHPPEDPDDDTAIIIGPEYSNAVIEFTRDFFQHVYVMPARLKQYKFK